MRARAAGLAAAAGLAFVLVFAASTGAALIVGTPGANLLLGTLKPDRMAALAGNDRIDAAGGGLDRVSCGLGSDLVAADSSDRLSSDCEVVSRRISTDPFIKGGGMHASEAEPDSFAWGSTVVATFQVARFSSGGARTIGFAVSKDAGRHWRNGLLPRLTVSSRPRGPFSRASDPTVAYDSLHGVWLIATLGFSDNESALLVSRSADGLHWSAPSIAGRKQSGNTGVMFDKEWIACDNGAASPFRGRCYLSYSDIERLRLATQTSTDAGRSWSQPVASPDNAGRRGIMGAFAPAPQPVALPDGTLVVPLYDNEIAVVRSTDGAASFSPETRIAPSRFSTSAVRAAPFPSVEVGADGAVLMAWPDCGVRPNCSGNDLLFSKSTDGLTWTSPAAIPLGAGDHVIVGLAADPVRPGRVAVAYYTESRGRLDVRLVRSVDGGATWSRPLLLSPERMPFKRIAFSNGVMVGDYISTSFAGGRAVVVFTLAQSKLRGRLRQATYAASVAVP
ncbi:MAG TPA: exo-alpha-sialidase [Gaiellaceae bacterium]|nr:exo-alpha-sialidase [Gaiellaceae bacterium]